MPVGDVTLFTETCKSLLLDTIKMPSPDCFLRLDDTCWEEHSRNMLTYMKRTLAEEHDEIVAVIVESLIQSAGGMRMYHPVYLKLLREVCDRYGVHLIHDEIAVGSGHTGTMFACGQASIASDFLCLPKALTGSYLPMSTVPTSETIYRGFYDDYQTLRVFLYLHIYAGNPLVYAAALMAPDVFEEDKVIEANRTLSTHIAGTTTHLADHPHVVEVRQTGTVLATEMAQDKASRVLYSWQERRGLRIFQHGLEHGALLRPLGSVVYFPPPYVVTSEQIDFLAKVANEGINIATRGAVSVVVSNFHPDHRDPG